MAELAIKWIESLSKTKVKQGMRALGDSKSGYCCLGWGCKITKTKYNPPDAVSYEFAKKVGLLVETGYTNKPKNGDFGLTTMNDRGVKFKEIAQFMKIQPQEYFTAGVAKIIKAYFK